MSQLLSAGVILFLLPLAAQPAMQNASSAPPESSLRVTLIDSSLRPAVIDLVLLDTSSASLRRAGGPPIPIAECLAIAPHWWLVPSEQQRSAGEGPSRSMTPPSTHLGLPPPRVVRVPTATMPAESAKPSPEPVEPAAAPAPTPLVESGHVDLIDGQRLTGHPMTPGDAAVRPSADGSLGWVSPRLGELSIPLDVVRRVVMRPDLTPSHQQSDKHDRVLLSNGDRISGFVESIGRDVVITPEGTDGTRQSAAAIEMSQVAAIEFSNADAPPGHTPMVWLSDGSVIAASKVNIDAANGRASLVATIRAGKTVSEAETSALQLGELAAIVFDHSRLIPLSSIPTSEVSGGVDRRIVPPATTASIPGFDVSPLSCDDIVLPGPMTVTWNLPKETRRVGGWLVLDDSHWAWGDCQVTVSLAPAEPAGSAPVEVLSTRLNALHPAAMMAMNVSPGQRLVVQVAPGESGPVDDQVTLRHVLLLTGPSAN